jgi:hypothetical protein
VNKSLLALVVHAFAQDGFVDASEVGILALVSRELVRTTLEGKGFALSTRMGRCEEHPYIYSRKRGASVAVLSVVLPDSQATCTASTTRCSILQSRRDFVARARKGHVQE